MSINRVHGVAAKAKPVHERFQFGPWLLTTTKSHILESQGAASEKFESELELPHVPEMVFADNVLRLQHVAGFGVEFNALDALRLVDAHNDPLKVAVSQAWKEARADNEHINEVVKPFDWTFSTDYKGTLFGKDGACFQVEGTDEQIDMEKLKVREKIHFYDDILLFEDELSDNGTSLLSVKIRVMPTSFFILLRFSMRVDNVIVRVIDTRLHHEAERNYILREFSLKDDKVEDLEVHPSVMTDMNEISKHLTVRRETREKLIFSSTTSETHTNAEGIR